MSALLEEHARTVAQVMPRPGALEWLWPLEGRTEWTGRWVWTSCEIAARNAYAFFRKTFSTDTLGSLKVRIVADTRYVLYFNGKLIGRGPTRGHLDWFPFDCWEISVPVGDHALAVLVHHIGEVHATGMTGRPGLLVDGEWQGIHGEAMLHSTSVDWKCLPMGAWRGDLPCLMSHFGFWEECDLRRIPPDWTESAFDDSHWLDATEFADGAEIPWKNLVPCDLPPPAIISHSPRGVVAQGTFESGVVVEDSLAKKQSCAGGWLEGVSTVSIPSKQAAARRRKSNGPDDSFSVKDLDGSGGHWMTFDFETTVSGYPVIDLEASGEALFLDVSYDDIVSDNGAVNPERSYARLTDRFRLRSGHNQIIPVSPRGFRFLTLDIWGKGQVRLTHAVVDEELYPFGEVNSFHCSDKKLERLLAPSSRTLKVCATDAFTDCASRERVQWMQDCYVHARAVAYAFGDTRLLRRALFQGAQNALEDGRINGFMPSERTGCAFASSSLVWLHLLVDYYLFSGDEPTVIRLLPTASRLIQFLSTQTDRSGLLCGWPSGQFWDWAPISESGCLLVTNGFYLRTLDHLASQGIFRSLLSEETNLETLRTAAHSRFWREEAACYGDQADSKESTLSQHGNTLAVLSQICPQGDAARRLLARITDPTRLGPVPVGEHSLANKPQGATEQVVPFGTLWFAHFLCEALFAAGMGREAVLQIHNYWGPFAGNPTFPETRIPEGNTTQCHAWSCAPSFLLPEWILGIRPVGPGWSKVVVAPANGVGLRAAGHVATPHGRISVEWDPFSAQLAIKAPRAIEVIARPPHHCRQSIVQT